MERVHLFELEDQPWCPDPVRNCLTDLLSHHTTSLAMYDPIVPVLARGLEATRDRHILDLCSGGGGPVARVRELLAESHGLDVGVHLSDKFPNRVAADRVVRADDKLRYLNTPVDATEVPPEFGGFRTIFTALHHFRPAAARRIFQDAVDQGRGIAAFEFTERALAVVPLVLLVPLMAWGMTPSVRPFSWLRLLLTYVLPIIPLAYAFDAAVSNLRTYSPSELRRLTEGLSGPRYVWDIGQVRHPRLPTRITYIVGYPL